VQARDEMDLAAGGGIAVYEFKLAAGHGYVDYLLFIDGHAVGVCEAKPAGNTLLGVEYQARKYVEGLSAMLDAPIKPLPFAYLSTGEETVFINNLDPLPRTRTVFTFHRPETLREWLRANTLDGFAEEIADDLRSALDQLESVLANLQARAAVMARL
jgi:type I restriction enzyme, R subunit